MEIGLDLYFISSNPYIKSTQITPPQSSLPPHIAPQHGLSIFRVDSSLAAQLTIPIAPLIQDMPIEPK